MPIPLVSTCTRARGGVELLGARRADRPRIVRTPRACSAAAPAGLAVSVVWDPVAFMSIPLMSTCTLRAGTSALKLTYDQSCSHGTDLESNCIRGSAKVAQLQFASAGGRPPGALVVCVLNMQREATACALFVATHHFPAYLRASSDITRS